MKRVFLLSFLGAQLFAFDHYTSSTVCKKCHPLIYKEFQSSQHKKSSPALDSIHKAVWQKHPLYKKQHYKCAKCHTPADKNAIEALAKKQPYLPTNSKAQREGVSCLSCHQIQSIQKAKTSNTNIYTKDSKKIFSARKSEIDDAQPKKYSKGSSFFGLVTTKSGSPFHSIDFTNKLFYNGNVCMGCHEHKANAHGLDVCKIDLKEKQNQKKQNCISCHMPKVQGSFTTLYDSKEHRYHGFSGSIHQPQMILEYVTLKLKQTADGFDIIITNQANHSLLLHPLREGELHVRIFRNKELQKEYTTPFVRELGTKDRPAPPWLATEVLKDTNIKAKESRHIHFKEKLHSGERVEVILGNYQVAPKNAKKLGLKTNFTMFKSESFDVK